MESTNSQSGERISVRSRNRIWSLFDQYAWEVHQSPLSTSSKVDYINFAEMFVRWIDGEFEPGATLR